MKAKNAPLRPTLAAASLLALNISAQGAGSIIVQDAFNRDGALVGSNANTGQTWTGSSTYNTFSAGSFYQVDGDTTSYAAITGLTFLASSTYCLAVDMEIFLPISDGYLALGYAEAGATDFATNTVGAFQLLESAEVVSHPEDLTLPVTTSVSSTSHRLEIILETDATLTNSTLTWEVDGGFIRTETGIDASTLDGVFLAHGSTDNLFRARFERFELLGPIPEPSTGALLALGGLAALRLRRRTA